MKIKKSIWVLFAVAALLLSGCSMPTMDEMYCPPKRSDAYNNLQSAIDLAMTGLSYCAPLSGEHQQTVQMADLDGDGVEEYLLFAKGGAERSLKILIFREKDGAYIHTDTIESNGSSFDQVEYAQMDEMPGLELIVGCQLSDQLLRTVSVYTFSGGETEQLMSANYTKFLMADLDIDGLAELFLLHPGQSDTDNGVAELYGMENGTMERANEIDMSGPVDKLKRIIVGKLHDLDAAVYVASAVNETSLITDVFACVDGVFTNVSFSNESGTSVQTLRNYYVYADDIDDDGVVELPYLTPMTSLESNSEDRHDLIQWYAMASDGSEIIKQYTYHNFVNGWYMDLAKEWAFQISVLRRGSNYEFHMWDREYKETSKVMTVFAFSGRNREELAREDNRFVLLKTDSVIYAAKIEADAPAYGITQKSAIASFHLIQQEWKTGEI